MIRKKGNQEERRRVEAFLEENRTQEPRDHVAKLRAITAGGEILAVIETMDGGDAIVTMGKEMKEYRDSFFIGEVE